MTSDPTTTHESSSPMPAAAAERRDVRRVPGDANMWFFVVGELWIFAAYFACYMFDRSHNLNIFLQGQRHLSQAIGILDTVLLLTSSLFVALSVQATRANNRAAASRLLALGGACGLGFVFVKVVFEWSPKLSAGVTVSTDKFFMYYFMLTGLHLFHVLLGLVLLGFLWREVRATGSRRLAMIEAGATYWHMVDLIWIVLFAVLYLVR